MALPSKNYFDSKEANKKSLPPIEWLDYEYEHEEKSSDWFWILGVIMVGGIILSVFFTNFLFAVIILIAGLTIISFAKREPEMVHFEINNKGIKIKDTLYPFSQINSFALWEEEEPFKLMIESGRMIFPHIIIPLGDVPPEIIRDRLEIFLPEEIYEESLIDKISEAFGF